MKRKLLLLIMVFASGFIWSQNLKTQGKKIVTEMAMKSS